MNKGESCVTQKTLRVVASVVTYNRKEMLRKCLLALKSQSYLPERIIIVDNASTDGTREMLEREFLKDSIFEYLRLPENTGSSGGQYEGVKRAYEEGFDLIWIMDDDSLPDREALGNLIKNYMRLREKGRSIGAIGSAAFDPDTGELSWRLWGVRKGKIYERWEELGSEVVRVQHLPFIGFAVPREVVEEIGFPEKRFFIWGEDIEYSQRIRLTGRSIFVVKTSKIYHPVGKGKRVKFLGREFLLLAGNTAPWKDYYLARNYILTVRKYGIVPRGYFVGLGRLLLNLMVKDRKLPRAIHSLTGFVHGLMDRGGKR